MIRSRKPIQIEIAPNGGIVYSVLAEWAEVSKEAIYLIIKKKNWNDLCA